MLAADPEFLKQCALLQQQGVTWPLEAGCRVARGFADFGYEEFLLQPGDLLISLISGASSSLPEAHRSHFFVVPTVDQMVDWMLKQDWNFLGAEFVDGRAWVCRAIVQGKEYSSRNKSIEVAVAQLVFQIMDQK